MQDDKDTDQTPLEPVSPEPRESVESAIDMPEEVAPTEEMPATEAPAENAPVEDAPAAVPVNESEESVIPAEPTPEPIVAPIVSSEPASESELAPEPESTPEAEPASEPESAPRKKSLSISSIIFCAVILITGALSIFANLGTEKHDERPVPEPEQNQTKEDEKEYGPYVIRGNDIDDFDLFFLKKESAEKNIVYSPLSIKYALSMLDEGAAGETKKQIEDVLGEYHFKNYQNSGNLSLANAFFIRDAKKSLVKESYTQNLATNYNASVIFDDFASPANVNKWVEDKTFGLVKNLISELTSDDDYIILNALAIDMEWKHKIQHPLDDHSEIYGGYGNHKSMPYTIAFAHENFGNYVDFYESNGSMLDFGARKVSSSRLAATANRYNIIRELGEDSIRTTVQSDYDKWANDEETKNICSAEEIASYAPDMGKYIEELGANYGHVSSSTDFRFLDTDDVKVFAKELKEYDGTTLEYVGIMPKSTSLDGFIKSNSAKDINDLIGGLKSITLDSFQDGVVTKLAASIPLFDFDYGLALKDDLLALGITDVFDSTKSDLSGISDAGAWLNRAIHKANIDFSNDGIKAAAATALIGGLGNAVDCNWSYSYDVPVVELDLTFDQPYMFLIRDHDSGEVWFTGAVYEPTEYVSPYNY